MSVVARSFFSSWELWRFVAATFGDDLSNLVLATFHRQPYLTDRLLVIPFNGFTQPTPGGTSEVVELILKKADLVPDRLSGASGGKARPEGIHVLGAGVQFGTACFG